MTIKKLHIANKIGFATLLFFSTFFIPQIYADLSVGDPYEGGTVFCVSQTPDITKCVPQGSGKYGLIMANEDQANFDSNSQHGVLWATKNSVVPGALSDDDGAANTAAIIAAHPQDNPGNNAAWLCRNYRGGGKEGWYLPSKNELNKMYLFAKANNLIGRDCAGSRAGGVQCLVGGYNEAMVYGSSTEYPSSNGYAWFQGFSNGGQHYYYKVNYYLGARAVRAFNHLTIQQFNNLFSRGDVIAGALVVMNRDDEKLLQEVVSDSATDGRVKKLISSILKRNQLLERFTPILTRNNPAVSGTPMVAAAASPVVTQAAVAARVVTLQRIMRDETFHNLTEEEQRLIAEIRNAQEEIIRGLQGLELPLPAVDFLPIGNLRGMDLSLLDVGLLREIVARIKEDRSITILNLPNVNLGGVILEPLFELLTVRADFSTINLINAHLSEANLRQILVVLQNNHAVTEINVGGNELTVELARQFKALEQRNSFTAQGGLIDPYLVRPESGGYDLRLNNIRISEELAAEIAENLAQNRIASMVIYDGRGRKPTAFKGRSWQIIVEALRNCRGLTRFIFNSGRLGVRDSQELIAALHDQQELRQFHLQGTFLGEAAVPGITAILRNNPYLTDIGLGGNNFGPDRVEELVAALREYRELTGLNLAGNNLGEAALPGIAVILRNNPQLTLVDLRGNSFGKILDGLTNEQLLAVLRGEIEQSDLLLSVAGKQDTDLATLQAVVADRNANQQTITTVITHPNANTDLLLNLAQRQDLGVQLLQAIVANQHANQQVVDAVAIHPNADSALLLELVGRQDTNLATLQAVAANRNANQQVLAAVAAHPHATPELLLNVLRRPDIDTPILQAIIANRNIDLSIIDMVALDPRANAEVLHAIAQNPITTFGILINVANHPNVAADTLAAMVRHPNVDVRGLQALAAKGSSIDSNGLRAITVHPNVNAEILAAVAAHPNADYRLLFDLATRQDLGENVILAIARSSRANRFVLRRILQRPGVSLIVLRAVAQHPNADAGILTLVGEHNNINSTLLSEIVPRLEAQPPQPVQPELSFSGAIPPPPPYSK